MAAADKARGTPVAGVADILLHAGRQGEAALLHVNRSDRGGAAQRHCRHMLHLQHAAGAPALPQRRAIRSTGRGGRLGGDIRRHAPVVRPAVRLLPAGAREPPLHLRKLPGRPRRRDVHRQPGHSAGDRLRRGTAGRAVRPGADGHHVTPYAEHRPADAGRGALAARHGHVAADISHGRLRHAAHRSARFGRSGRLLGERQELHPHLETGIRRGIPEPATEQRGAARGAAGGDAILRDFFFRGTAC